MRKITEELREIVGGIQAVERNLDRVLASMRMPERNVSDVGEFVQEWKD